MSGIIRAIAHVAHLSDTEFSVLLCFPASAGAYVPTVCNGREVLDSTTSSLWLWIAVQFSCF